MQQQEQQQNHKELLKALQEVQVYLGNPDKTKSAFNFKYTPLEELYSHIKDGIKKCGNKIGFYLKTMPGSVSLEVFHTENGQSIISGVQKVEIEGIKAKSAVDATLGVQKKVGRRLLENLFCICGEEERQFESNDKTDLDDILG